LKGHKKGRKKGRFSFLNFNFGFWVFGGPSIIVERTPAALYFG